MRSNHWPVESSTISSCEFGGPPPDPPAGAPEVLADDRYAEGVLFTWDGQEQRALVRNWVLAGCQKMFAEIVNEGLEGGEAASDIQKVVNVLFPEFAQSHGCWDQEVLE